MSHRTTSQPSTTLCFCVGRGSRTPLLPKCAWRCREMQERRKKTKTKDKEQSGWATFSESHLMLLLQGRPLPWVLNHGLGARQGQL